MKNIVHICLTGPFTEGLTYQDNLLPKYHATLGYDVSVIASEWQWGTKNNLEKNTQTDYINRDKVRVLRIPNTYGSMFSRFKIYSHLYQTITQLNPSILFVHGCQFLDIFTIVRYLKTHPDVRVYVDNHADFSNSAQNWLSKNILHKIIWRMCAHAIEPYAAKFYGVLPARVDFLKNIYKLPAEKCELLVMGADDERVEQVSKPQIRMEIRQKYGIEEDDFLIVTGGKIDAFKTQTILLMQAVQNIKNPKVKLLLFGSVSADLQPQVKKLTDGKKVQYIGWINGQEAYQYFAAADLVCFPGRHSVFWEQVTGQGIPMIVKDWPGTHHVDVGGNVRFLTQDSTAEIQQMIEFLLTHPDVYQQMKQTARQNGMKYFSYKEIAKRSIEEGV